MRKLTRYVQLTTMKMKFLKLCDRCCILSYTVHHIYLIENDQK